MHLIVILCLFAAVAAHALNVDRGAFKSFEDGPRISVNRELQNKASSRIVNGNEAVPKQFPYQAGLFLYKNEDVYDCGGSIISSRWVLTAAHCTYGITKAVDVYLGAWNRNDSSEANQNRISVSKKHVILHEKYDDNRLLNDLSLIKLPVVIQFNDYIQPVNLPKKSSTYPTYVGKWAIASGWGRHGRGEKHDPNILRWAQFPVITNEKCSLYFPNKNMSSNNFICTRSKDIISNCFGDSGGPLVLADGSRTLIGVSSFGRGWTCENNYPNGFVRITSYLDWIAEKTGIVDN